MDPSDILDLIDKHGTHGALMAIVAILYMMVKELKSHRKELKAHRDEESESRKELIRVSEAVKLLLDRESRRFVQQTIEKEISGVHDVDPRIAAMAESNGSAEHDNDVTPITPTDDLVPSVRELRERSPHPKRHNTPIGGYHVAKRPGTKGGDK
jgi:hypothetical protein